MVYVLGNPPHPCITHRLASFSDSYRFKKVKLPLIIGFGFFLVAMIGMCGQPFQRSGAR